MRHRYVCFRLLRWRQENGVCKAVARIKSSTTFDTMRTVCVNFNLSRRVFQTLCFSFVIALYCIKKISDELHAFPFHNVSDDDNVFNNEVP